MIAPFCVIPTAVTLSVPVPKLEEPKLIALESLMATVAPVEFNATEPEKSLLALPRVITPAPALNKEVPATMIAPLCVMPTAVTVKEPLPKVEEPKSIALASVMATLLAPELFKLTDPVKSLDWVRVITPAPALKVTAPAEEA